MDPTTQYAALAGVALLLVERIVKTILKARRSACSCCGSRCSVEEKEDGSLALKDEQGNEIVNSEAIKDVLKNK